MLNFHFFCFPAPTFRSESITSETLQHLNSFVASVTRNYHVKGIKYSELSAFAEFCLSVINLTFSVPTVGKRRPRMSTLVLVQVLRI